MNPRLEPFWSRCLFAFVLSISPWMLAACGDHKAGSQVDAAAHVVALNGVDQPLRDDFNRDRGFVRLLLLVDPRCPECLRGLADMGDDVLAKLPKDAPIKVYVVHEPVIGGGDKDIPAAAELLHTTLARHYWNPTGDFGRQMSQVLGLLHGSSSVYAWDIYMIYPPNAVWSGQDPPQPSYLMHHLPGLDNQKFPPWNGKIFATKVNDTLAAIDRKIPAN
jgi:hypothetical protein